MLNEYKEKAKVFFNKNKIKHKLSKRKIYALFYTKKLRVLMFCYEVYFLPKV